MTGLCGVCARVKPSYIMPKDNTLIQATQPFDRISMDFKGPVPTASKNKYLLTIIDEFSRFPFAFPCPDMNTSTVIQCLVQLFSLFGMPGFIHTDQGTSFMSSELKEFLTVKGVSTSRTTPYNPEGNGQVERYNGIIWRTIRLAAESKKLPIHQWEQVLPDALHSIRSLLCTSTNETPHERLFKYPRRSTSGTALPTWLMNSGKVLLKRSVRNSKHDPYVDEVELVESNPSYAHIRYEDGRESTVSLKKLAPLPPSSASDRPNTRLALEEVSSPPVPAEESSLPSLPLETASPPMPAPRVSSRIRRPPDRLTYDKF